MRRAMVSLLALAAPAAAALPSAAAEARPARPDPVAPELRSTPVLVRDAAHHVTLHLRFDRALPRRFDGEPLATAAIDGRIASLAPVAGHAGCYTAGAWIAATAAGRLVAVSVSTEGAAPATVSALVAIRGPRAARARARGAPLGC
jgi:hypothetical protein